MIRTEWWRQEVHITLEFLADLMPSGALEEWLTLMVRDSLREQGGLGEPRLLIWRVRPTSIEGAVLFVLQGDSLREV
jgi:hypothetical protein